MWNFKAVFLKTCSGQLLPRNFGSYWVDFSGPSKYRHVSPSVWPEFPNTTLMHTANQHACPQLNGVCVFTITIKWACYKTSKSPNEWTGRSQLLSALLPCISKFWCITDNNSKVPLFWLFVFVVTFFKDNLLVWLFALQSNYQIQNAK